MAGTCHNCHGPVDDVLCSSCESALFEEEMQRYAKRIGDLQTALRDCKRQRDAAIRAAFEKPANQG